MWKNILLFAFIGLTALMGFACGRKEISIPTLIKIPPNLKPWPIQAALIIPPETKNIHYWSPDVGPSGRRPMPFGRSPFLWAGLSPPRPRKLFPALPGADGQKSRDGRR